jgi:hypothetical protein
MYYLELATLSNLSTINLSCEFRGLAKEFFYLYKQGEVHITFQNPNPSSLTIIASLCECRNTFQGKRPSHCGVHYFVKRFGSIGKMASQDQVC